MILRLTFTAPNVIVIDQLYGNDSRYRLRTAGDNESPIDGPVFLLNRDLDDVTPFLLW